MNKNQTPSKNKKGASVGIAICFVAAIALVGTYTLRDYQETKRQEQELTEQTDTNTEERPVEEENRTDSPEELVQSEEANTDQLLIGASETESTQENRENEQEEEEQKEEDVRLESGVAVQSHQISVASTSVDFTENSQLLWPVDGNVMMSYNMDQTVYFSTLDQYKYNPAMIIASAEGDQVICGAPGIIKSIDVTAQTGTTVNVDLGNGYELFYGQLKEVPVNVGDYVEATSVLGYVSQPTKYYSVEGCNVYFEMRKDGQPINPMDFMAE